MAFASIDCILVISPGILAAIFALPFFFSFALVVVCLSASVRKQYFWQPLPSLLSFSLSPPSLAFSSFSLFLPVSPLPRTSVSLFLSFPFLLPLFSYLFPLLLRSLPFQSFFLSLFSPLPFPSLSLPPARKQSAHVLTGGAQPAPVAVMTLYTCFLLYFFVLWDAMSQEMSWGEL